MKFVRTILFAMAAALGAALLAPAPTLAQGCGPSNPNCAVPNRPANDSTNSAANTRFVLANGATSKSLLSAGAKCDGTTDDTAAINAALATGGSWSVPAGLTCFSASG